MATRRYINWPARYKIPAPNASASEWQSFNRQFCHFLQAEAELVGGIGEWTHGDCGNLAVALKDVLGPPAEIGTICCESSKDSHACHVFVRYGDRLIDGDGVTTNIQSIIGRCGDYHVYDDYEQSDRDFEDSDFDNMYFDADVSMKIRRALLKWFAR